jgi:catecholate siderophore receptor
MGAISMSLRRRLIRDSAVVWPAAVLVLAGLQAGAARADEASVAAAPSNLDSGNEVSGVDINAPEKPAPKRPAAAQSVQGVEVVAPRKLALPLLTEPVMETPQTITLITEQVMQLAGLTDLRDVLRLDPSVSQHADEDSGQGTNVEIRGFSARFDIYRDGQLDLGQYYRDPFDLETVEVLTGPSSVLFGRGSTGGAINDVSKKPTLDGHTAATLTAGDEGLGRLTGDVDAPLSATSAVRINGMADYSPTAGRDQVYTSRFGVSPVVAFGIGTPTEVTLGLMHQTQWGRPDYGVPWIDIAGTNVSHPAAVPWGNYYGFKDDFARTNADIGTVALKQDLAPGWTFNDQARYAIYSRSFRGVEPGVTPIVAPGTPLDEVTVTRTVRGLQSTESLLEDQADISGRFQLWGVTHKLVFGGEVGRQTSDPTTDSYSGVPGTNLISPDETALFSGVTKVKSQVDFTADTAGVYVGDTIEYGRLFEVEGVARIDRFAATFHNSVPTPVTLQETDTEPSYRAAFVYKPAPAGRIYVMYGTSFDPSAEGLSLSATTADLAPEREHTVEAGIKWEFDRVLLLSGAVFDTVQDNFREPSPTDSSLETIAGTARSRGIELEAQGHITPRWVVLGGYTYLDAKIISSPNNDIGQPLQDAPRNSLRLFSAYDVTDRLTMGGGMDYSSSRVPSSVPDPNNFRQEVPGYTTFSVLARYQLRPDLSLQLNVDNLFDKHYYDGTDDNHVNVGASRSVHLTLAFRQ